ncbi:hypothetical protein A1S_3640 [Acinetobacter baumannii ATCC 17978]|nr:hypothetical protein A1S_3640 [Acinetobacter baumannii ATCC 17978]
MAQNLANHTPLVLIGLQAVAKICLKNEGNARKVQ